MDDEYASVDDSTYKWKKTTVGSQLFFQYLFGNTPHYNEQYDVAVTATDVATNDSRFLYGYGEIANNSLSQKPIIENSFFVLGIYVFTWQW